MTYETVKKDEDLIQILKEIDKQNNNIYHGLTHSLNVIKNIEKICTLLKINENETNLLKVAALLHDVGHQTEKENHQIRSYDFAKEYLKNKLNKEDYEKILNAINKHHEKENIDELTLFEHILLFADKMDFSYKNSVKPDYKAIAGQFFLILAGQYVNIEVKVSDVK